MFMAFNVGEGMLLVLLPVLARREFDGDASTFGLMLSSVALAATVGSFVVGALSWRWSLGCSIAVTQTAAGVTFLGLAFVPRLVGVVLVLILAGALVSPMTIRAQTIRMRLIPPEIRGRTFGVLRTLMQSTPPIGGAIAGVMLAGGRATVPVVIAIASVMSVPVAIGLVTPALADSNVRARESLAAAGVTPTRNSPDWGG
jgi:MFS family permease